MRKLFIGLGIVIAILAVGFIVLTYTIDGIVKSNIESEGSSMLNTTVEVENVDISLLGGRGTIGGIVIENPQEFSDSSAIELQQIDMKVDLFSLLSDTVVIDSLMIQEPVVLFEQTQAGNNLNALTENLDMSSSGETSMIIDYLRVDQGLVRVYSDIGGERSAQAEFEQIELTGVGRAESNTVRETLRQILEPIIERAAQEAVKEGLLEEAKDRLQNLLDG